MKAAILLIDIQNDYLDAPGLEPCRGALCAASARLLAGCRNADMPIVHIWTTVHREEDGMPHWRTAPKQRCIAGTPGHTTPPALRPRDGEFVVHKQYYSAFSNPDLETHLQRLDVDTVILAGLHLRACLRTTAIDAYQRRLSVWIADDAAADDDAIHAAITRQYLAARFVQFLSVDELCRRFVSRDSTDVSTDEADASCDLPAMFIAGQPVAPAHLPRINHISPLDGHTCLFQIPVCGRNQVQAATEVARKASSDWSRTYRDRRGDFLMNLVWHVEAHSASLARQITAEIGKPIVDSWQELKFTMELVRACAASCQADPDYLTGNGWIARRRPLGAVAIITPWNNPLAIALGKIAPAVAYGNAVVWKPALAGASVAVTALQMLIEAGLPAELVTLVQGDHHTSEQLISDSNIDAVALTGSPRSGSSAQVHCARRGIPLQAELGGNNAAVVWSDADLPQAAAYIAQGAFASAGQRCTATRRAIVDRQCVELFMEQLLRAVAEMGYGDPLNELTQIGPVVSKAAWTRISGVVERARAAGFQVVTPSTRSTMLQAVDPMACYYPPTIIYCDDRQSEIVAEETFGPVLVVQLADSWEQAIELCNGVSQGLVASLFSKSTERERKFLGSARAGMLKINSPTAGAKADAPFCGWKSSGIGPPEHSVGDVEFYTRWQTIYRKSSGQQIHAP